MLSLLRRPCMAFALAFLASALASTARAQRSTPPPITWTITVDLSGAPPTPKYTLQCTPADPSNPPSGCPNNQNDPKEITVSPKDKVRWQGSSNTDIWIIHEDDVLYDKNTNFTRHHHSHNGTPDGGEVDDDPAAADSTPHEYYVVAYNSQNQKFFYDDPRIIIGGTGIENSIRAIYSDCAKLRSKLDRSSHAEQANHLCEQIEHLLKSLEQKDKATK
jgi:hypothetical protein